MKRTMVYCNIFWLLLSTFACVESYRFKLGSIHTPGPGFFPFVVALVMFLLALAALLQAVVKKDSAEQKVSITEVRSWKIAVILITIVLYAVSLEALGFLVNTFLFVTMMLKVIEPQSWKTSLAGGILAAVVSEVLFNILFQAKIPTGILGF